MSDASVVSSATSLNVAFGKTTPVSLKKVGVSSFQRVWEQVYDKTEQMNRESAVGSTSVSGTDRAKSPSVPPVRHDAGAVFSTETEAAAQQIDSGDSVSAQATEIEVLDRGVGGGMSKEVVAASTSALWASGAAPVVGLSRGLFAGDQSALLSGLSAPTLWKATLPDAPPSAPSAEMQTVDNTSIFRDILDQIRSLNPKEGQTIVLNLDRGDGVLRVEVSVDRQRVRADILTHDPAVKSWLEGNQSILHQALARQGFGVERFSVSIGDPEHDFSRAEKRETVAFLADPVLPAGSAGRFLPLSLGRFGDSSRSL